MNINTKLLIISRNMFRKHSKEWTELLLSEIKKDSFEPDGWLGPNTAVVSCKRFSVYVYPGTKFHGFGQPWAIYDKTLQKKFPTPQSRDVRPSFTAMIKLAEYLESKRVISMFV